MTKPPQAIDRVVYDQLVAMGDSLGYTWRRHEADKYQTVRSDGSVALTFGPVHEDDREYFDAICDREKK